MVNPSNAGPVCDTVRTRACSIGMRSVNVLGLAWWHWLIIVAGLLPIALVPRIPPFRRGRYDD